MDKEELQCENIIEDVDKSKKSPIKIILIIIILILLCLCLRSCQAEDVDTEALPQVRTYEESSYPEYESFVSEQDNDQNNRLNLALARCYRITDEYPIFYIGFPQENVFDVIFTLKDLEGKELYQTNFVAPGTNTAIDGTAFLQKGKQQVECLVSIYEHDSGTLISDCTTIILNINYE